MVRVYTCHRATDELVLCCRATVTLMRNMHSTVCAT
jgi:hypothetical protein